MEYIIPIWFKRQIFIEPIGPVGIVRNTQVSIVLRYALKKSPGKVLVFYGRFFVYRKPVNCVIPVRW
jgi:hypothetical protein